ncbi:MAG: PD-(D/E)XK nuclease family protein [Candidatus Hydrogenedentes bacterium]|nr:PD-(D/E)XK nuclease family protein [Candidatus Hydrogenedentota bacterium]
MPGRNVPDNMWRIVEPSHWPDPAAWNSFSALLRLEQCPRRWALSNASYPGLWDGKGYPQKLHLAAIEGTIVHSTVEVLIKHLVQKNSVTRTETGITQVLREIGGYTRLVQSQIDVALKPFNQNPRTVTHIDRIRQQLIAKLPELRFQVQTFVSQLSPVSGRPKPYQSLPGGNREHGALPIGAHMEVTLETPELRWRGVVDLLVLSESSAEITDFKTGEIKSEHEFQIRTYALLWMRDKKRNPHQRVVSRLLISYPTRSVEVPVPTDSELALLEAELRSRTESAQSECVRRPPRARPDEDACKWCEVRHLCGEYWEALRDWFPTTHAPDQVRHDIQLRLTSRSALTSWTAIVEESSSLEREALVTVRFPLDDYHEFQEGQSLRLLDVHISYVQGVDTTDIPAISVGVSSETFVYGDGP